MNDLPEQMRAATDGAPPSRIDLDSFIAREQRRSRLLRWGGASTAATVLVAALLLAPALYAGGGSLTSGLREAVCPTPGPNPTRAASDSASLPAAPSAQECADTVARLSAALRDVLAATAPGRAATPLTETVFVYRPEYAQYDARVSLSGPGGTAVLHVEVSELTEDPPSRVRVCPTTADGDHGCSYEVTTTGAVVFATDFADTAQVHAYREDGTGVMVSVNVPGVTGETRPAGVVAPLTPKQLTDIAQDPGLSLFPGRSPSPRPTRDAAIEDTGSLLTLLLRERLPDGRIALPTTEGTSKTGYRTEVTVDGQGSVSAEMTPPCSGGGCPPPPACPEAGATDCTLRADHSVVTVWDTAGGAVRTVRVYETDGRSVTLRVEGPLVSRLTAERLSVIADELLA
ncbi:hypothetical protein ACFQO7_18455 [Catellatospora aurea]|uniref:DUF4367 domain-containing protein n=1 Tax=Catellatospora aurea TaxID=1337874 RepID=A0ABW2H0H2_9ACTN